ncbi:hypothetical protein TWF696_004442 [Orbilia brochopaga]|uniref:Uncharacterized protein n=1 Tax=Orbilia brochopaga TaxID=3140254 RepID=A0AAV9V9F6_9PEZI
MSDKQDGPGEPPLPIFEEAILKQMLDKDQLDCKQFLQPRHEYLLENIESGSPWLRPIYQNVQTVMDHSARSHNVKERRDLHNIKDLLGKIAKLDNNSAAIYSSINETFQVLHDQQNLLNMELAILNKHPVENKFRMTDLKSNYEVSWRSLRADLKAQRDILAIQEDIRSSYLKELNTVCEKNPRENSFSWWNSYSYYKDGGKLKGA